MRFGLFGGPAADLSRTSVDRAYHDYIEYVATAERLGFESVFLTEHHFTGLNQASSPMTLLAYMAAETSRIRLGTGVTVLPWHNPIVIAEQAATVDVLSGGRLDLGVGRGFRASEFEGFGLSMDEATERYDEAVQIILKAWRSEGRWSHHGRFWQLEEVIVEPEPVQVGGPPIWVGAGSERSLGQAAENGFRVLLDQIGTFETTGERVAAYREKLTDLGREFSPYDVAVTRSLHIVDGPKERQRAIEARTRVMAQVAALANSRTGPQNAMAAAFSSDIVGATENGSIIGDVAECVERLHILQDQGVEHVLIVDFENSTETLQVFANEIMPRVAATPAEGVEAG
jgi:alkanesulfonate monooxygenase SsuD/methylene tetrahydromethanopterin reductase-like flavin-dependent oxidoreductase (luciferase family)